MFENITFFHYQIPSPFCSDSLDRQRYSADEIPKEILYSNSGMSPAAPGDNVKNATYCIFGGLDIFMRPPLPNEVSQTLYHMENFSIFTCASQFYTRRRDYRSYLILYTYEGQGLLEYRGQTYHLHPGDGFFIDCIEPHFYRTDGANWKHGVLHLNGPLLPLLYRQYLKRGTVLFSQPFTGHYQNHLEDLLHIYSTASPYRDWTAADCISHILTQLLNEPADTHASGQHTLPDDIQYLITYMENNFSGNLSLDYLSEFSGISKYHLSREFKKYTGSSPINYLIQLRIEHAKTLLRSTNMPANKIAHTVGIHDLNNFTNLFRKKTGATPGEFRKNILKETGELL